MLWATRRQRLWSVRGRRRWTSANSWRPWGYVLWCLRCFGEETTLMVFSFAFLMVLKGFSITNRKPLEILFFFGGVYGKRGTTHPSLPRAAAMVRPLKITGRVCSPLEGRTRRNNQQTNNKQETTNQPANPQTNQPNNQQPTTQRTCKEQQQPTSV